MTDQSFAKNARIAGTERKQLSELLKTRYEAGVAIRQLAEESNRSYGFVHRMLVDAEVQLRGRGGSKKRSKRSS